MSDRSTPFGHWSRWLISKDGAGDGWRVHAPMASTPCLIYGAPTFDAARELFVALTGRSN